jgi:hypothetical protein
MNLGSLPHSERGLHGKSHSWLDDKTIRLCCVSWLDTKKQYRAKHPKCPKRHWLAADFKDHVDEVLANMNISDQPPATICLRTAMNWLNKLGYHFQGVNTFGAYTDKHDDKAVAAYRNDVYIPAMREMLKQCEVWITVTDENGTVCVLADEYQLANGDCIPQDRRHVHTDFRDSPGFKPFVLGVHDESTVHVHDTQKTSWEPEGEIRMKIKSSGSGIMISEIIFEKCRYLACDDTEWATFCAFDTFKPNGHTHCTSWAEVRIVDGTRTRYEDYPLFLVDGQTEPPRASLLLFEYGKSKAGYFTTEHFVRNQFAALMLFEFLFPENRLFAVYDNATIHRSRGNDSLDASVMNLSPGGRQRKQRDTMYKDKTGVDVVQRLVTDSNVAKGLLQILSERGETWVKKPSKPQAVAMLNKYDDFKDQSSWIERIFNVSACGHRMLFAPKCHPELQYPIESSWAKMKGHIRRRCKHTLPSLRENIIAALQPDNIPLTLVQKWFRKMRDYMAAYEDGATGKTADKKVKQYRSHRQCFDKTPAGGSYLPEPIRLVERDSIIDLTEPPSVEMVASAAEHLGEIGM